MTKFELLLLSEYLVEMKLVECENKRSKVSAISKSKSLCIE